jgi:shikimate dehydrogenase
MSVPYAEVIGDPIAHSKSPLIHKHWLQKLRLDGDYCAVRVTREELEGYFEKRRSDPDWSGCNITIPHKELALDHVEDRGGLRTSIGAINTVLRNQDGSLIGTNTDAAGFYAPISGLALEGSDVVMVGAGGAARAVLFALKRAGVSTVTLLNRTPLKAAGLLATFGLEGDVLSLDAPLPPATLLINASPLGMVGQPPLEIDLSPLHEEAVVYDLVYAPLETKLLTQAHNLELATVDGLEMLIGQAAIAFELFFGEAAPRDDDAELRELLTA